MLLGRDHKGRVFRTRFFCFVKSLEYLTVNDSHSLNIQCSGNKTKKSSNNAATPHAALVQNSKFVIEYSTFLKSELRI